MLLHKRPLQKKYQNANVILVYYNAQCFIIELWKDAKDKKKAFGKSSICPKLSIVFALISLSLN